MMDKCEHGLWVQLDCDECLNTSYEDLAVIKALRHEDCSCEECLLRLQEKYDEMAEDYKRLVCHDEDLGEGC